MNISIIGGGNMGSAIALGLATSKDIKSNITVINRRKEKAESLKKINANIIAVANDYTSLKEADIIILAVKPWLIKEILLEHKSNFNKNQLFVSVASGITLDELSEWTISEAPIFRVMPNTAIAIKKSMSFIVSKNASEKQDEIILNLFTKLGKAQFIDENLFSAATSLSGCGIAFAFRYIRASIEGAVEMGIKAHDAKDIVIQTLRGAADLLEANNTHPEEEIDKVTTPGGITIKGLNEMEHAGFSSAVIKGLKASNKL